VLLTDNGQHDSSSHRDSYDSGLHDDGSSPPTSSCDITIFNNAHSHSHVVCSQNLQPERCATSTQEIAMAGQEYLFEGSTHQSTSGNSDHVFSGANTDTPQNEQLRQLQLQIDQMDKVLKESQQSHQKVYQQLLQQVDDIHMKLQLSDQRMDQLSLQHQQMKQRMDQQAQLQQQQQQQQQIDDIPAKAGETGQHVFETDHENSRDDSQQQISNDMEHVQEMLRRHQDEIDHIRVIQYRVKALLAMSFKELTIPRLFIILPRSTGLVDNQGKPCSLQFKLYYLCECGLHTMGDKNKQRHEIHMAQHPGYDLQNHNLFFDKFGPYVLAMMYMVKYGSTAAGRCVPPLPDFKIDVDQEYLDFAKKDINRLVDDMIAYLEDMIRTSDTSNIGKNLTSWELDPTELAQLRLYLKVQGNERMFGNLSHTTTREGYSVWVCSKHNREYHGSTMKKLKELVSFIEGGCGKEVSKTKIRINNALAQRFIDAIGKVHWIQSLDNQSLLTETDLRMDCNDSTTIFFDPITGSLVLDLGRFTLSTSITQDGTRDIEIEMDKLGDLTHEDLSSLLRCQHNKLTIRNTPQCTDEDRLINILQRCAKLEVLRIGCLAERSLAIVNLVKSTRKKILRNGKPSSLRTFKLMGAGLIPFNSYDSFGGYDRIVSTMAFSKDGSGFDMHTSIRLITNLTDGPVLDFLRHYFWTIETLTAPWEFNDLRAAMIRDATRVRGSWITTLKLDPFLLTANGQGILDEIIRMSPSHIHLGLWCTNMDPTISLGMTKLVGRYRKRLYDLKLSGESIAEWLPPIMVAFPTRDTLPKLSVFTVTSSSGSYVPQYCLNWIITMVSVPPQQSSSSGTASFEPLRRLERFTLNSVEFPPEEWASLIKAIDLTALEWLDLKYTNFSQKELKLLVRRIVESDAPPMRLRMLCIDKELLEQEDARVLCAILEEKLPLVKFA